MGLFDTVIAACPKCGAEIQFQSKDGYCSLDTYKIDELIPVAIASGLNGEKEQCSRCNSFVVFESDAPERVKAWVK